MESLTAKRKKALKALNIDPENKVILCLEGGGIRGILTLQLLKKMEEIADMPCYELFDMVAGTSTGGIIAGLIASSKNAVEIEELYINLVTKVFKSKGPLAHRFGNPPKYDKTNYRKGLYNVFHNTTLQKACAKSNIDLLITAKDVTAGEETFFTCFKNHNAEFSGTYKDILLRSAMEATMSAPTYFTPLERFVDGGTTTYNNPTLAAIMEAVHYGPKKKYDLKKLTVFNFGTGTTIEFIKPEDTIDPKGVDARFWLNFVMRESSQDASEMQIHFIRSGLIQELDFRRFQISLDSKQVGKLPDRNIAGLDGLKAKWLKELTDKEIKGVELDDVKKFPIMRVIGEAMVEFIMTDKNGGRFKKDLINDNNRDLLVSTFRDSITRINTQMSDPKWLDSFES